MNDCFLLMQPTPVVVLPVHEGDLQMMIKNLQWMRELDGQQNFDALISQDGGTNKILAGQVMDAARAAFRHVDHFIYERAPMPRWPHGPNWAFQSAAWHIYEDVGRPWFWMESDCVPLRAGWLPLWFGEYARCGKPLMGAVVEGRSHCNGTAIFPANFPEVSPAAMKAADVAFDWVMQNDTIALTHNSKLLFHIWGEVNGKAHPYDGQPANFLTQADVDRLIPKHAVLVHRAKYGTLIDRLRERRLPKLQPATAGGGMLRV